ncbi:MAG: hypothetical protein GY767_22615 [Shimia sp.]|nr:hypothetical protein [Shimia sp.]
MKALKKLIDGLAAWPLDVVAWFDLLWLDLAPATTRFLAQWEQQFGLFGGSLDEDARRLRLAAAWQDTGGQTTSYIESTLVGAGFSGLSVAEWWIGGTEPAVGVHACATPADPTSTAALVNVVNIMYPDYFGLAGEPAALCGEPLILCGNYLDLVARPKVYAWPTDPTLWPYVLYISGTAPATRREELERLLLRICPCHLWLGLSITYS